MSNWPEPTHEADEPPRWPGRAAAFVVAVAAIMILAPRDGAQSWRLPEFDVPEFSMPTISMPDFSSPAPSEDTPPATASISEDPLSSLLPQPAEGPDGSTVQRMPYADCLSILDNLTNSLGQPATIIEDTANLRVTSFKFLDSTLRVTCDGAEGTMTVQGDPARVAP